MTQVIQGLIHDCTHDPFYSDGCAHALDSCIVRCLFIDVSLGVFTSKMSDILYHVMSTNIAVRMLQLLGYQLYLST